MTDAPKQRGGARPGAGRKPKIIQANATPDDDQEKSFLDDKLASVKKRTSQMTADEETLRTIFELGKLFCSQDEAAAVLGVARTTFQSWMAATPVAREAWDDGLQHAKVSLRRKQLALADKNAPAAIFLGKNYLGQKDEHHTTTTVNKPATEMSEAELMEIAMRGRTPAPAKAKDKSVH